MKALMKEKPSRAHWILIVTALLGALVLVIGYSFYPNGMPIWFRLLYLSFVSVGIGASIFEVVKQRRQRKTSEGAGK